MNELDRVEEALVKARSEINEGLRVLAGIRARMEAAEAAESGEPPKPRTFGGSNG